MSRKPTTAVEEARALLADAGLELPPIPPELAPTFEKREKWFFSSPTVKMWPYFMDEFVEDVLCKDTKDFVLLAHQGHGVNSYAVHYFLVRRPLFLFVQAGWGGVYMDTAESTALVNAAFRVCHEIVSLTEAAVASGRLEGEHRLLILASDFYRDLRNTPPETIDASGRDRPIETAETAVGTLERWRDWLHALSRIPP